jgi:hypothetical protein
MKVHMLNGLRKHSLLGDSIVEEEPSYMVRYDLNTMENDINWLQAHTSASHKYPEWWKSQLTEARDRISTSRDFLDYAIDERQVPSPAGPMNGFGQNELAVEESIPGQQIEPQKPEYWKPALVLATVGFSAYMLLFGGRKK